MHWCDGTGQGFVHVLEHMYEWINGWMLDEWTGWDGLGMDDKIN